MLCGVWLRPNMTTQRLHLGLHFRCGKKIRLSNNSTVAERVKDGNNGIVFTEQPVALGTVFQVKILMYTSRYAGSIVSV